MDIFMMVCAAVCLFDVVGYGIQENRNNFTFGYMICGVAMIIEYIMKG